MKIYNIFACLFCLIFIPTNIEGQSTISFTSTTGTSPMGVFPPVDVAVSQSGMIFVTTNTNVIYVSNDGGTTFLTKTINSTPFGNDITIMTLGNKLFMSNFYVSNDNANSWNMVLSYPTSFMTNSSPSGIRKFIKIDEQIAFAFAQPNLIVKTIDGGSTWSSVPFPPMINLPQDLKYTLGFSNGDIMMKDNTTNQYYVSKDFLSTFSYTISSYPQTKFGMIDQTGNYLLFNYAIQGYGQNQNKTVPDFTNNYIVTNTPAINNFSNGAYQNGNIYVIANNYYLLKSNISDIIGVNEYINDNKFKIYPNPSIGVFNYQFLSDEMSDAKIEVYDITGKSIMNGILSKNIPVGTIDLSNVSNGIYFIKVANAQSILFNTKLNVVK